MQIITRKTCGAKCRTKQGAPCLGPSMANGRCRMHNGGASKRATHARETNYAKLQRKKESVFLKEIRSINEEIDELLEIRKNT